MPADLIPTFDFGVHSVPTKATLEQQALSLRIFNLDLGDLASGLLPVIFGFDSQVSGFSLNFGDPTGLMWADQYGNLWIMDNAGPVKVYRYNFGWDSRRYWIQPTAAWAGPTPLLTGFPLSTRSVGESEAFDRFQGATTQTDDRIIVEAAELSMTRGQTGHYHGLLAETCASGYNTWNGRGGHAFRSVDVTSGLTRSYDRDVKNNVRLVGAFGTPNPVVWEHVYFSADFDIVSGKQRFQGYVTTPNDFTSATTDGNFAANGFINRVEMEGWNFGIWMAGYTESGGVNP